jgi:hypothetical protein
VGTIRRFYSGGQLQQQRNDDTIRELMRQVSELQSQTDALTKRLILHDDDDAHLSTIGVTEDAAGRGLQSSTSPGAGYTYASTFGVLGDASTDDGPALQSAIDSAAANNSSGIVLLPAGTFRINEPLIIPGGVTLQGMGYGSSPLAIQFDAGGSVLAYCGPGHAVKLAGHAASLRDLAVYDWPYTGCEDTKAAGGILVEGDGTLIESVIVSNVFVYFFLGGPALSLVAKNYGGVPFGNYQNLRIRHAKVGIYLSAEEGSFVNTNSFLGGGMSGGGFDTGIYAEGPGACNDNKFYGVSFSFAVSRHLNHYHRIQIRYHNISISFTPL